MLPKRVKSEKITKMARNKEEPFQVKRIISYINLKLETGKHDEKFGNSAQKKGETKNGVI